MQQTKLRGSVLLLIVGILMIIAGAFGVIISLLLGASGAILNGTVQSADLAEIMDQLNAILAQYNLSADVLAKAITTITILLVVSAILDIVFGILGIAFRNKAEKANLLFIFGIILVLVSLAGSFLPVIMFKAGFSIGSFLISLVLPVLYVVGAALNKS